MEPLPRTAFAAIDQGATLRDMNTSQLEQLTEELRAYLLYSVGQSGGHFGAGLGVIHRVDPHPELLSGRNRPLHESLGQRDVPS